VLTIVYIDAVRVELTDEQQLLQEAVAGVVSREAGFASVRAWAESNDHGSADALAARQGWTGIGLDEELGGQGGGLVELVVLAEQLGSAAVPWDRTLAGCLAAPLLVRAGTDEAHELASATAEGIDVSLLCLDGRSPLNPLSEGVVSGGSATLDAGYVPGAARARELIVPVKAGDAVALFAVSADAPGVVIRGRTIIDRTRSLADVALSDAPVRALGTVSFNTFASAAAAGAVLIAADALGAAKRLLELTTAYVADRRQFGVPVGSFQAVKHAAAEMLVDVEASRSAVHYAAWAVDAGAQDAVLQAPIAKAYACSAAVRVGDKALFLHGAIGYTWEHDLQFLFKRAKSDELLYGTPDAHRDLIAAQLGLVPSGDPEPHPVA
jgi:alkylation response protein AidB-like acyl-CoA dehydrogenase